MNPMHNIRIGKFAFFFLVAVPGFLSCTKTQIDFGGQFLDNSYTNIVYVDTFSTSWSTIYRDSFPTSGTGSLLVGRYTDPLFGKISALTAFHLAPPPLIDIANTATFDSLTLILKSDKSFYGDSTVAIRYNVFQLTQKLFDLEGNTAIYNNRNVEMNPTLLGSRSARIRPHLGDSVEIRLSDALGMALFTKFRDKADEMKNEDDFINYFKGLVLAPDASETSAIYGFSANAKISLFYHENNLFNTVERIDFNITQTQFQFNQIRVDRSGTPIEALNAIKPELPSSSSEGGAYMQPATGLFVKVRFPSIRDLLLRTDYKKLMKAQLVIKPFQESYTPSFQLPPQVNLYATDQTNTQGTAISSETGNLVTDYLQREATAYTFDVTGYLTGQLSIATENKNGLLLNVPTGTKVFDRALIRDGSPVQGKSYLKLYYLSIKKPNP